MILLDMDGVIVDFVGAALRLHDQDVEATLATWPRGEWNVAKVLGVSTNVFWSKIDEAGEDWWATLPEYPWADELIAAVEESQRGWVFATSPSRFHGSASGKVRWMQKKFGSGFRGYMLGEHKNLFARREAILIDDNEEAVKRFRAEGGGAVLFPRPWNSLGVVQNPVEMVKELLV